jgi:hypothetical protein
MSTAEVPSLQHLLADDAGSPKSQAAIFESSQTATELWQTIRSDHPAATRNGVAGAVLDGLTKLLSLPVSSLFAGAWNAHRTLRPYADPKKHPPDEINLVPLDKHTIRSTYKPHVDVFVQGTKIRSIEFELELALEIQAAVLKIQSGRIREIEVGSCTGKGKLSCAGAVIAERESQALKLPGVLRFEDGIAIKA